jgi:hypothetical protein
MRLGLVDPVGSIGEGNRLPSLAIWETATGCPAEFASTNLLDSGLINSGLRGVPVGTWANALRANGLKPFFRVRKPPLVTAPLYRSRRVIWLREGAFTISARLSRALCASVCRCAMPFRYGQRSHNTHISKFMVQRSQPT